MPRVRYFPHGGVCPPCLERDQSLQCAVALANLIYMSAFIYRVRCVLAAQTGVAQENGIRREQKSSPHFPLQRRFLQACAAWGMKYSLPSHVLLVTPGTSQPKLKFSDPEELQTTPYGLCG